MMLSELEPAYQATRAWALSPVSHPPARWAQIVRHGLATWMPERPPSVRKAGPQEASLKRSDGSGLLSIVAAMIAEGCQ
jgi:hypothetical protein